MPSMKSLGIDSLSIEERRSLAEEILRSLSPPGIWNSDSPGVHDEMDRRVAEMEAGEEVELDWDHLHNRLLAGRGK